MHEQIITNPISPDRKSCALQQRAVGIVGRTAWVTENWLLLFSVGYGVMMIAPFMAPVFMHWGWTGPAQVIYSIYSLLCHQMAQRSFFLFGAQPMYAVSQFPIPVSAGQADDMLALRAFIGNDNLGWKVAWSDRMVYVYGSFWLAGLIFSFIRTRYPRYQFKPLGPINILLLALMPVDGITHFISDAIGGITGGFRYDNQWLANLTEHIFPTGFYVGDALGSFNSWARLITGVAFGLAIGFIAFPAVDKALSETAITLRAKLTEIKSPTGQNEI